MVVKDKVGRKRYIAFTLEASRSPRRHEMIKAINNSLPRDISRDDVRLTAYNGEGGIVQCQHTKKDDVIKVLNGINRVEGMSTKIVTIATSGTIKTVKEKLGELVNGPL